MNPSIERVIREFVAKRIDFIKTGNREGLDSTYDLFRRNEYNCHDYDWYIRQIDFDAFSHSPLSTLNPHPAFLAL